MEMVLQNEERERRRELRRASDVPYRTSKRFDMALVGIALSFLIQFATTVWWGATLTAGVNSLKDVTVELKSAITLLTSTVASQGSRLGVVESKVDDLRTQQNNNNGGRR